MRKQPRENTAFLPFSAEIFRAKQRSRRQPLPRVFMNTWLCHSVRDARGNNAVVRLKPVFREFKRGSTMLICPTDRENVSVIALAPQYMRQLNAMAFFPRTAAKAQLPRQPSLSLRRCPMHIAQKTAPSVFAHFLHKTRQLANSWLVLAFEITPWSITPVL